MIILIRVKKIKCEEWFQKLKNLRKFTEFFSNKILFMEHFSFLTLIPITGGFTHVLKKT